MAYFRASATGNQELWGAVSSTPYWLKCRGSEGGKEWDEKLKLQPCTRREERILQAAPIMVARS